MKEGGSGNVLEFVHSPKALELITRELESVHFTSRPMAILTQKWHLVVSDSIYMCFFFSAIN